MSHAGYVPLRAFSAYSMLDSTLTPKALAKACVAAGFPACALTDRDNLFGAMEWCDAAASAGVQPIVGATLSLAVRDDAAGDALVLLAQDEGGYATLARLVSRAHFAEPARHGPRIVLADLADIEGLLALTGGADGGVCRLLAAGQADAAARLFDTLVARFPGRLFAEIARTGDPVEAASEAALVTLADARGVPLVATNPARFLAAADHAAHDVLLCIADGAYLETAERRRSNPEWWLKGAEAMAERFADLPDAVANTLVVAQRCAAVAPSRKPILPTMAASREAEVDALRDASQAGLAARLAIAGPADPTPYQARLAFELDVIARMGFAGYFLIVADFIGWAKRHGIPVGPGRGSGAGSVVAWALTITDLDPLALGLLFERFLNPERVSMPDFDIDFCETRREEVIRYVAERHGADRVAQIITFGKLKARAVLKDVGRVLQLPYGQIDRLAKLVPNHPTDPWDLKRTLDGVPEFALERERDNRIRHLIDLALALEGLPRHASTHAAGVVIGDRPLDALVPLYRDPRTEMPVTQFDMKWVEKAGLVKFDFLGLKTLSVLQRAVELLAARGIAVDLATLPLDDPAVYALIGRGDTVGVFQLESDGMRRTLAQVRPDCFEDIIALVSLYRPGPMDNIPSFAARKHGRERIEYPHPLLEPVLRPTYGIAVYQEQVMEIARVLAGYSLGEADLLRRAMGKKIKAEMDAQQARFVDGAAANGVDREQASEIFHLVEKFAGYGFNKSHAAAYALIAYQTAWLKAHHACEFYAASMAYDIANTDKLAVFADDARRMGVALLAPCLNASGADFSVEDGAVRWALGALKAVGTGAMEALVAARATPFRTPGEIAARINPAQLNRRQLEALAAAGALVCVEPDRARAYALAEPLLAAAQSATAARDAGQSALFGGADAEPAAVMLRGTVAPWTLAEQLAHERAAFGFYFSGHPVQGYAHVTAVHGARTYAEACALEPADEGGRRACVLAAMVESAAWRTPNGQGRDRRFLTVTLSDASGQFSASCFDADAQGQVERAAAENAAVLIQAELNWRPGEDQPRVAIRSLTPLADIAGRTRCDLALELAPGANGTEIAGRLAALPAGGSTVTVCAPLPDGAVARLRLAAKFALDAETARALERAAGVRTATLTAAGPPRLKLVA